MTSPGSLAERVLIATLAAAIARSLNVLRPTFHGHRLEGYVNPGVTSRFLAGCNILWRLGIARGAVDPDHKDLTPETVGPAGRHPYFYKFMILEVIGKTLLEKPTNSSIAIDDVLTAYMGLSRLDRRRVPFAPDPQHKSEMEALANAGYAERRFRQRGLVRHELYQWTDLIGPAMRANYYWDEDLRFIDHNREDWERHRETGGQNEARTGEDMKP